MATTIKAAFKVFSSNLELTDRQEALVSSPRENLEKALIRGLSLHSKEATRVTGSWDRRTLTRYLSEADVDVMVILKYGVHKDWDTSEGTIKALDRFKALLDDAYPDTSKRRAQNCITMQFSEFKLDVVPTFKHVDGYYKIPDSVRKLWVPTNPFTFAEKITEVNKTMDERFVPLIKMVKGWNREVGWPVRSFHLECLMYNRYRSYKEGYTYCSMLKYFFEKLPDYLARVCYDPVMRDRVGSYLDNEAKKTNRQIAIEKAKAAAATAKGAYELQRKDEKKAIKAWQGLMGEFFPAYG